MFDPARFFGIRSAEVEHIRPFLEPMLRDFEQETAVVTADEVFAQAKRAASQLWSYHDGEKFRCVIATTINEGVGRKGCLIWVCFGHEFLELAQGVLAEIERWAKSIGCTHMEVVGRKGWKRVMPGYRDRAVVFEKSFLETH